MKKYFNKKNKNHIRRELLEVGDLVFVFDVFYQKNIIKAWK